MLEKPLSKQLEALMTERENLVAAKDSKSFVPIVSEQQDEYAAEVIYPVICEGDVIGSVVILSKDAKVMLGETEQKLACVAAGFLGRQMEA